MPSAPGKTLLLVHRDDARQELVDSIKEMLAKLNENNQVSHLWLYTLKALRSILSTGRFDVL